jgi:DMSO/TMAO reductase YedYZ heme-binding membrane subunit
MNTQLDPQVWWHLARATGIVAWALGVTSVLWGVALATRALGKVPRAPWLLDLHRFLGGATVLFVVLHVGAVVADSYVHFGVADVLVPFASDWEPGAVASGVIALWLLLAVEVTSLLRQRLPKRAWRAVHLFSYLVAVLTTAHLLMAGTDAGNPIFQVVAFAWVPVTGFFLVYRWVGPRRAARVLPSRPAPGGRPTSLPTSSAALTTLSAEVPTVRSAARTSRAEPTRT